MGMCRGGTTRAGIVEDLPQALQNQKRAARKIGANPRSGPVRGRSNVQMICSQSE